MDDPQSTLPPPARRWSRRRIFVLVGTAVGVAVLAASGWLWSLSAGLDDGLHEDVSYLLDRAGAGPELTLIVGMDRRSGAEDPGRADAVMVLRHADDSALPWLLAIPRNLRVPPPEGGGQAIEVARAGGHDGTIVASVAALLDEPLDHVAIVDFDGMPALIDALGGIEVDNPVAFRSTFDGRTWSFADGPLTLNGVRARAFARARTNELERASPDDRRHRQALIVAALAERVSGPRGIMRVPAALRVLDDAVVTDLSLAALWRLARSVEQGPVVTCRLGGNWSTGPERPPTTQDAAATPQRLTELLDRRRLRPSAGNRSVIAAFRAASADRPPLDSSDEPAGCSQ